MVIETLRSLQSIDYPNYEIQVTPTTTTPSMTTPPPTTSPAQAPTRTSP